MLKWSKMHLSYEPADPRPHGSDLGAEAALVHSLSAVETSNFRTPKSPKFFLAKKKTKTKSGRNFRKKRYKISRCAGLRRHRSSAWRWARRRCSETSDVRTSVQPCLTWKTQVFTPCFSVSVFCGFKEGLQKENVLFSMFFPDAFTKKVGIDKFWVHHRTTSQTEFTLIQFAQLASLVRFFSSVKLANATWWVQGF